MMGPQKCRRRSSLWDLVDDVVVELSARKVRALLVVGAVALSTGALIASLGIAVTAAAQVGADIAAATLDVVEVRVEPLADRALDITVFPHDADDRAEAVDLVASAGRRLDLSEVYPTAVARNGNAGAVPLPGILVVGATSGYLEATHAVDDETYTFWLDRPTAQVAFLGPGAARDLGVPLGSPTPGLRIWINAVPYDVVGEVEPDGPAALDQAVVIPYAQAVASARSDADARMLVRTLPGGGAQVAGVIATAIRPDDPARLEPSAVVSLSSLRNGVSTQLDRLAAWIGSILLALAVLLVANSMIVSVAARTSEIGLRRALGSSPVAIASLFVVEGAVVGGLGGLVGSGFASSVVVVTSILNGWDPVLDPLHMASGPLLGLAAGVAASVYPSVRAARISPAIALRAD